MQEFDLWESGNRHNVECRILGEKETKFGPSHFNSLDSDGSMVKQISGLMDSVTKYFDEFRKRLMHRNNSAPGPDGVP